MKKPVAHWNWCRVLFARQNLDGGRRRSRGTWLKFESLKPRVLLAADVAEEPPAIVDVLQSEASITQPQMDSSVESPPIAVESHDTGFGVDWNGDAVTGVDASHMQAMEPGSVVLDVAEPPAFVAVSSSESDTGADVAAATVSLLGDANGNGELEASDVLLILNALHMDASISAELGDPRDVDGDGFLTVEDANITLTHYLSSHVDEAFTPSATVAEDGSSLEPTPEPQEAYYEASYESTSASFEVSPSYSYEPAPSPTYEPSPSPSYEPTPSPTYEPSPSPSPSYEPTPSPSYEPTPSPSYEPTPSPSPSSSPSPSPSPKPCDYEHLAVKLDYDDRWSNGNEVKGPNDPELGVAIFEAEIPFEIEIRLQACTTSANYTLVLTSVAGGSSVELSAQEISVGPSDNYDDTLNFVLRSGNSQEVELHADLYFNSVRPSVPSGAVALQGDTHELPPLIRLSESITENTDRWRMKVLDVLPEKARSNSVNYLKTVAPAKAAKSVLGFLMTHEMEQQVIAHIQKTNNVGQEKAVEEFERRLDVAASEIASDLEPLFADYATRLFMLDRPVAEALAGQNDSAEPLSKIRNAIKDMQAKIDSYLDKLPSLDDFPSIKKIDFDIKLANISDVVEANSGKKLEKFLEKGQFRGLWDAIRKTDVKSFEFVESISVSYPVDGQGILTLSAEDVSATGIGGIRFSAAMNYSQAILGRNVNISMNPSMRHKSNDPFDIFGKGQQQYEVGVSLTID